MLFIFYLYVSHYCNYSRWCIILTFLASLYVSHSCNHSRRYINLTFLASLRLIGLIYFSVNPDFLLYGVQCSLPPPLITFTMIFTLVTFMGAMRIYYNLGKLHRDFVDDEGISLTAIPPLIISRLRNE